MDRIKNTVLIVFFMSLTVGSFAQFGVPNLLKYDKERWHFGILIGYNLFDYAISTKPDLSEYDSLFEVNTRAISGYSLGIVTNLRLGKYFDLRFIFPTFSFGSPMIFYGVRSTTTGEIYWYPPAQTDDNPLFDMPKNLDAVWLSFPVLLKYKSSRMFNNIRAFVVAGGQVGYDLISNSKKRQSGAGVILKLQPWDVQAQVGAGFDFYCTYFKFTTEFKMSFGLLNTLKSEKDFGGSINSLKAKNIQISFIFE